MINKVYLQNLLMTEDFNKLLDEIEKSRPTIPVYDAKMDNTEEWKSKSNSQNGFDLCFRQLRGINK